MAGHRSDRIRCALAGDVGRPGLHPEVGCRRRRKGVRQSARGDRPGRGRRRGRVTRRHSRLRGHTDLPVGYGRSLWRRRPRGAPASLRDAQNRKDRGARGLPNGLRGLPTRRHVIVRQGQPAIRSRVLRGDSARRGLRTLCNGEGGDRSIGPPGGQASRGGRGAGTVCVEHVRGLSPASSLRIVQRSPCPTWLRVGRRAGADRGVPQRREPPGTARRGIVLSVRPLAVFRGYDPGAGRGREWRAGNRLRRALQLTGES
jgi:hypothetical protein